MKFTMQPHTCNTSRRRRPRGSASTGVTTAAWWPGRCRAREAKPAPADRTEPTASWTSPASRPISSSKAGLYCGSVHATPTTPISPNGLCPANLYGSTLVSIPAAGHGERRSQPAPHRAAQSLRHRRGTRQYFPGRQVQVERAPDGDQSDEQRGALQFPFDLQRHSLCVAARDHGDHRVPFLAGNVARLQLLENPFGPKVLPVCPVRTRR